MPWPATTPLPSIDPPGEFVNVGTPPTVKCEGIGCRPKAAQIDFFLSRVSKPKAMKVHVCVRALGTKDEPLGEYLPIDPLHGGQSWQNSQSDKTADERETVAKSRHMNQDRHR